MLRGKQDIPDNKAVIMVKRKVAALEKIDADL